MITKTNKGHQMEELLRVYFLKSGYYVARGIPFKYKSFDVTDIDLWLYNRTSSVSREISIVDIKNKKTPQAIERIFWVKGLQAAVKATNALVATTDKRPDVKSFGKDMDVFVLDGTFLSKLTKFKEELNCRITDEDFYKMIDSYSLGRLDGDWKGKLLESKSLLARGLDFDNTNKLIEVARFFVEQILTKPSQKEVALRCFYKICSFIAINIDFIQKDVSFLGDTGMKKGAFTEGFKYGSKGEQEIKRAIDMSLSFIEQYSTNGQVTANQTRHVIYQELEDIQTSILAEYFSKNEVLQNLFKLAITFETMAMKKEFVSHTQSPVEIKSFISVLLDFYSVDRLKFSNAIA